VRILLTNDDGITSDGLWAAARGLARVGDLTVIGTADDWSNGSASIRHVIGSRIARFEEIPDDLPSGVEAYSIEASPGGAVLAGLMTGLFEPFDLVASGANYGINVGGDLLYSGTFGAAVIGFQRGVTAFAISSERGVSRGEEQRWDGIADVAERIAAWMLRRQGTPVLLNVNVPNRSFVETTGARIVRPVRWANLDRAQLTAEPEPDGSWRIAASFSQLVPSSDDPESDFAAVMAGQIAVSHLVPIGRPGEPPPADLQELLTALAPDRPVTSII
jgi:5'-nucleotidase